MKVLQAQSAAVGNSSRGTQNNVVVGTETSNNEYNPYDHRDVKRPTSFFDTWIHLLKANLGTGILAMPSAFRNAGYAVGVFGMAVVGILCTYCVHLLITTSYRLCVGRHVPSLSYANTVAAAFEEGPEITRKSAPYARLFTNTFLVLYQIGSSSIYVVFIAKNLKTVGDVYLDNAVGERMYMVYLLLPLIAITWLRDLKRLAPFSSVATSLTVVSLLIIVYYIFSGPISFSDRQQVGTVRSIPQFFGTVLFAMEAIGMILPLQNEMKNPSKFGALLGVLNISMFIITLLYTVIGLLGYLRYGNDVKGSVTLDLPENEVLSQIVKICLSLSIYINYALSNYIAFSIIWNDVEPWTDNFKYKIYVEHALRTAIVLLTFFVAVTVPNLEHLISLIGAFCLSTVGIALPAIVSHLTFLNDHRNNGFWTYSLFCLRNLLIVTIAVFAFIIGVSTATSNIMSHVL